MGRSINAIEACAYWLSECLKMGWPREYLDELEKIWWRFHDDKGRLIGPKK